MMNQIYRIKKRMEENTNINEIGNSKCDGVQKSISDFKNRVQRYCPRFKDIQFELECEWENCEQVHKNMDEFMLHIDYHLSTVENSDCKWRMCDSEGIASVDDLKRHVKFHAFHAKIKQIGRFLFFSYSYLDYNIFNINYHRSKCAQVIPRARKKLESTRMYGRRTQAQ